jgi:thiamine transport system permease protein
VIIPIAHALVAIPFVVRAMLPALRSIDHRLRDAAAILGASPARVWRTIDLPLIAPPLAVAAGFAFAVSLGEFGATSFLSRRSTPTVPIVIGDLLSRPGSLNVGRAYALATVLAAVTAVVMLLTDRLQRDDSDLW